jgi:hypothetical protein
MKNLVFWDIKTEPVHHRRHVTSPLQSTAVTMMNAVLCDVMACSSYKNQRFGETCRLDNHCCIYEHRSSSDVRGLSSEAP